MFQDSVLFEKSFFEKPLFDNEESAHIYKNLMAKYGNQLEDKYFILESGSVEEVLYVKLSLQSKDESFCYPVIVRMAYEPTKKSQKESATLMLDYLDYYFSQYLKDNEVLLTTQWSEYECDGHQLHLVGQIFNLKLEKEADEILKKSMI